MKAKISIKLIACISIGVIAVVLIILNSEKLPTYLLQTNTVKDSILAANSGNKDAMWDLYFHFEESGEKDKAFYWLRRGASIGDTRAQYKIYSLLKDSPNPGERKEAVEALKKAASLGDVFSALQLGKAYIDGTLVERDVESGKKWLGVAVLAGNIEGMLTLADLLTIDCKELGKAYGLALLANEMSGMSKTYQLEAARVQGKVLECAAIKKLKRKQIQYEGEHEVQRLKALLTKK